jgi:hypothetical protein
MLSDSSAASARSMAFASKQEEVERALGMHRSLAERN